MVRGFAGLTWGRRLGAALWLLPSQLMDWVRHGDDAAPSAPAPAFPDEDERRAKEAEAEAGPQGPLPITTAVTLAMPELAAPAPARRRRSLRGWLGWALYLGFIVVAIMVGPMLLAAALQTGTPLAAITSSSMWPTLKRGDLVLIKGVDSVDEVKVGDIVAFENEEAGFVIHRVTKIEGDRITTKGDANTLEDEPWSSDHLIGKVLKIGGRMIKVPYMGSLPLFFRSANDGALAQPEAEASPSEAGY